MSLSPALPRHALITGGARRIGRGIALALAQSGFDVSIHCHTSRAPSRHSVSGMISLAPSALSKRQTYWTRCPTLFR